MKIEQINIEEIKPYGKNAKKQIGMVTNYKGKPKLKRKWQNLLYKKCPNCGNPLEDKQLYFSCPKQHPAKKYKSCFFIKKEQAAQYLLDINHPANSCLTKEEREKIDDVLKTFGISIQY